MPSSSRSPSLRMCGIVLALVAGRHLAQLDQLLRVGVVSRGVLQGRGDAQGTIAHLALHQPPHLLQVVGRRLLVLQAEDVLAHGRRPQERRHVLRDALALEEVQVFAERGPLDVVLEVGLLGLHALLDGGVDRAPRPALAHDLRGDALTDLALAAAVGQQGVGGPAEHVDEAA